MLNDALAPHLHEVREKLNQVFPYEPIILIGGTAITVHVIHLICSRIPKDGVVAGGKRLFFRLARKIPAVRKKVEEEMSKTEASLRKEVNSLYSSGNGKVTFVTALPSKGLNQDQVVKKVEQYLQLGSSSWKSGSVSGSVYHGGKELTEMNSKVFEMSTWTNPLHNDVFPGICKMECEVVRMAANLFHGGPESCGTVTSGGSESIILAVKAYRDYGMKDKGIRDPEMVVPVTAHAAFDKAAQILDIKIWKVPLCSETWTVDTNKMKKYINKNTIMLVGSSPAFPYGCMDDIAAIAKLGVRYGVPVHTDACLGGFLLAFMPNAGFAIPPFDFALKGVTSISADTHKFGFAPKGSSVLLFSEKKYKHHQYFITTDWPGGLYASPTFAGSRPGAIIAGCWATMLYFGLSGYTETTKRIVQTRQFIESELRKMRGIFVVGNPATSVVALGSNDFDIFRLMDGLKSKGWMLSALQFPSCIQFSLTHCQTAPGVAQKFVKDVKELVTEIMKAPGHPADSEGAAAIYGASQRVPDRSIIGHVAALFLDALYETKQ